MSTGLPAPLGLMLRGSLARRSVLSAVVLFFAFLMPCIAIADINPWIVSTLYNPEKWDTAGPYTGTPWLHPPTWTPNQEWGVFSGKWKTAGALTGSWGGGRDQLLDEWGISLLGTTFSQFEGNASGGERQGASIKNDFGLALFMDLERSIGLRRGYFTCSLSFKPPADSVSSDYIGNQFPVQLPSDDDNGAARLVHLAFGQQLLGNTSELAIGRMITGEDFASLQLACTSLNQAICANPIAGAQSISFPTYPSAVWGGRFKVKPHANWYGQVGTYLVFDDFRDPDYSGVNFSAPSGSGMLTLGEFGYLVGKRAGKEWLPGVYKIGGYYDGEQLEELDTGEEAWGTWGIYVMGQQMLYSENDSYNEGLSGWLSLSYAPEDRNTVTFMLAGGLSYQGLFPTRPQDSLSFIGAYGKFSDELEKQTDVDQTFEGLLEMNYRIQFAPWVFLQPNMQYIINPDGQKDIDDALVLGFSLGIVL